MELDDLKKTWNAQQPPSGDDRDLIRHVIRRSHRGLTRLLRWELAIGCVMLIFFIAMIGLFQGKISAFYYKLTVPLAFYAIPVYYRLYRSARFLQRLDFSGDLRSTLTQFLNYYTSTLRIYQWGGYAAIGLSIMLIFLDEKFQGMTVTVKGMVLAYMIFVSLLIGPFVKRFYSSKAKAIREYLDETRP